MRQPRVPTFVFAPDPLFQAGVEAQLRARPEVHLVTDVDDAAVAVVAGDEVDDAAVRSIRALQRNGCPRVVAVVGRLDDSGVLAALEAGACGLLRREDATAEALVELIRRAADGDGSVPPDLLGRLMAQVGRLQREVLAPRGLTLSGRTDREIDVLRLVADGLDTAEIARTLAYSERTIKNIIHDVTTRFCLRNRTHAVAFAVREGII